MGAQRLGGVGPVTIAPIVAGLVLMLFGASARALAHVGDVHTARGGPVPLRAEETAGTTAITACSGAAMPDPDQVITGSFGPELEGSYVMLPFEVPEGTDAVRVKYCHDQPLFANQNAHTLDMGIYDARPDSEAVWGVGEFRGWGGSSRKDVTISGEGSFDPDPNPVATEETTVGYRPGPTPAGQWAVELGVAAVGEELASEDGEVAWRVEIDLIDDPAYSDEPYEPAPYDATPANSEPGWYAGDVHVHARHSNPNDATMRETFDFAFAPLGEGAGLDFITLSDYVSDRAWGEIGAFQPDYPGKLIVPSAEVITYRGHANNHGSLTFVDYRTGPIHEAALSGGDESSVSGTSLVRSERPASEVFDDVHAAGGWTQINHPETFPSEVPTFSNLCRGCSWDYTDAETDYSKVDAIEIATGPAGLQDVFLQPGPNPFTTLAIEFYEDAIDADGLNSNKIAAVGSSDSHNAGQRDDPITQAPIGQATTVVQAPELSMAGIEQGVHDRHTYVKPWGQTGPDLRLEASAPGSPPAIMGDVLEADSATFSARVLNLEQARAARPGNYTLTIVRDGSPLLTIPIPGSGDEFTFEFPSVGHARYGLQVLRPVVGGASIEAYSSPIWLEAEEGGTPPPPPPACSVTLKGSNGADTFQGTDESDAFRGRRGGDEIHGRGGDDCLSGNRGRDRVKGGSGEDELRGGRGRDRLKAADGEVDEVHCGRGRKDRAEVDSVDSVRGCERIVVNTPTGGGARRVLRG